MCNDFDIVINKGVRGVRCSRFKWAAAVAVLVLVEGACSSSSHSSSPGASSTTAAGAGGGSGSGQTYTVGVLTDLSGPGSVTGDTTLQGIKAGIGRAAREGYHIKYVVADTGTSLTQAETAAKTLVAGPRVRHHAHIGGRVRGRPLYDQRRDTGGGRGRGR